MHFACVYWHEPWYVPMVYVTQAQDCGTGNSAACIALSEVGRNNFTSIKRCFKSVLSLWRTNVRLERYLWALHFSPHYDKKKHVRLLCLYFSTSLSWPHWDTFSLVAIIWLFDYLFPYPPIQSGLVSGGGCCHILSPATDSLQTLVKTWVLWRAGPRLNDQIKYAKSHDKCNIEIAEAAVFSSR